MKSKKIHVAFLMGGLSSEREVSLNSGNACYDAIDKEKYYATKIIVDKNFYDQINSQLPSNKKMGTLSMGMSQDYQVAIQEGSTMVRVGGAIFG